MAFRHTWIVAAIVPPTLALFFACASHQSADSAQASGTIPDADEGGTDSGVDAWLIDWSVPSPYDPYDYSADCNVDLDCVIRTPINNWCETCCGADLAIRETPDEEAAYAKVTAACQAPGHPGPSGGCGLFCPEQGATCFAGRCALLMRSLDGGSYILVRDDAGSHVVAGPDGG